MPRRFATREDLVRLLRELGDAARPSADGRATWTNIGREMPSKSLYWHTFGSLTTALREAGFDVPVGEERLGARARAGRGARTEAGPAAEVRGLDGRRAARTTRCSASGRSTGMFEGRRGAWAAFQFLVREQLVDEGVDVSPDGTLV